VNSLEKKSYLTYYPSPIGILKIKFNNSALLRIDFEDKVREIKNNCRENFYQDKKVLKIYNMIFDQLNQYFMGERKKFDLPLCLNGSQFQLKVWNYLKKIPYAKTISYLELAKAIDKPAAARAVGQANNNNPISIIIPCHRVIASDGSLKGYADGLWRKKWLLEHEKRKTQKIRKEDFFCLRN